MLITLTALLIGCVITAKKTRSEVIEALSATFSIVFGILILICIVCLFTTSYRCELYIQKRAAFSETLQESRLNGNEYETAAIVREVSEWNIELAEKQYNNKTILFNRFIDDRVEDLKPIR